MTCLSSGEEQPHSSSLSSEQQSIPNSTIPESSVPHTLSMGSEMEILLSHQNLMIKSAVNEKFEQF